jgi:hypothetical protein
LASQREMAGQAGMQSMMDYQAQKALGTFSRGATSSTDMAALSAELAGKQFESQLGLGIEAAKDYQQRQQALYGAMQNMAGYQEKVTADRQQDWYERAERAAQMKEAGPRNLMGAAESLAQMGMMGMMYGGDADSFTDPSSLPTTFKTSGLFAGAPKFAGLTSNASGSSGSSYGNYRGKLGFDDPSLYSGIVTQPPQPGFFNGIDMNNWRGESGLYNFKRPGNSLGNMFNNIH